MIKICGITNEDDALHCIEAGADLLGLVHYPPSPRHLSPKRINDLLAVINRARSDSLRTVLVVVSPEIDSLIAQLEHPLDFVQIHRTIDRQETERLMNLLQPVHVQLIQTIRDESTANHKLQNFDSLNPTSLTQVVPEYIYELGSGPLPGGNGAAWNWGAARPFCEKFPTLLAGGLTPENVMTAIESAQPLGVDISSGVESSPGIKDIKRVKQFIDQLTSPNSPISGNRF